MKWAIAQMCKLVEVEHEHVMHLNIFQMGVINVMISPSGMPPQGGDSRVILVIYSPSK